MSSLGPVKYNFIYLRECLQIFILIFTLKILARFEVFSDKISQNCSFYGIDIENIRAFILIPSS